MREVGNEIIRDSAECKDKVFSGQVHVAEAVEEVRETGGNPGEGSSDEVNSRGAED